MTRFAVVGHVEWIEFALVSHVPVAGEIIDARSGFSEAAGSAAAISPTLRAVPLATLNAPGVWASSARRLAAATSRTWTKSRRWAPSSKTRGDRPAASEERKMLATPA